MQNQENLDAVFTIGLENKLLRDAIARTIEKLSDSLVNQKMSFASGAATREAIKDLREVLISSRDSKRNGVPI
jgi:hypothetical protein